MHPRSRAEPCLSKSLSDFGVKAHLRLHEMPSHRRKNSQKEAKSSQRNKKVRDM